MTLTPDEYEWKCHQEGCAAISVAEVFWPGKATKACFRHVIALFELADVMGFVLEARHLKTGEPYKLNKLQSGWRES